ncbi:MAG: nitroreductase family protein [Actinomycetota bacterium]
MEFQRVVERRRMVRAFQDRPLPERSIQRILANAARAPSAGFSQGWAFLALVEAGARARFWEASWPAQRRGSSSRLEVMRAPCIVVSFAHKQAYLDRYAEPDKGWVDRNESRWPVPYWQIDTAFATMLMLLTAVDEELAAVFFAVQNSAGVAAAFGVPPEFGPIGATAIGYPAPDERSPSLARGRRPLADVVHRDAW